MARCLSVLAGTQEVFLLFPTVLWRPDDILAVLQLQLSLEDGLPPEGRSRIERYI